MGVDFCKPAKLTGDPDSLHRETLRTEQAHTDPRSGSEVDEVRKKAQQIIGGLLWLSTRARPDLAYQVAHAASLAQAFPDEAFSEGKHILRYLRGSMDHMLKLTPHQSGDAKHQLVCFTDASFAPTGKSSPTGVLLQWHGVSVAWRASRTALVVLSVCEAEMVAIQYGYIL